MTRFSRILTIVVTLFSIGFMAVAAVAVVVRTDWRARAKEFPDPKLNEQQQQIAALDTQIGTTEKNLKDWNDAVEADDKLLSDRIALLQNELQTLEDRSHKLSEEIEAAAARTQTRLDDLKLRREDIFRLQAQYDELVAQKHAVEEDVKRLKDLLIQAQGVLLRVESRHKSLEAEKSGGPQ